MGTRDRPSACGFHFVEAYLKLLLYRHQYSLQRFVVADICSWHHRRSSASAAGRVIVGDFGLSEVVLADDVLSGKVGAFPSTASRYCTASRYSSASQYSTASRY